jgi:hypothetical protein
MNKTHLTAALLILQLGRTVSAQEMSLGSCQIFGQVFGIDPLGGDMLVKSPSGDIGGLRFDQTTIFIRASLNTSPPAPAQITPAEVSDGDLVCARASGKWDSVAMAASQVVVASRPEIQKQQRAKLLLWSNAGVSGSVVKLNQKEGSFILERILPGGARGNLLVETSPSTQFRQYPTDATTVNAGAAGSWAQIRVGEKLYVRGDPGADGASIQARMILLGGFQALTAAIDSMDALAETVKLHDLSTGKPIQVHISPSDLFLLNPGLSASQNEIRESSRGRRLQTLDFGDLQAGDSVVLVGNPDDSGWMRCIALIADFGEIITPQSGGQVSWELGSMKLDLP